MIWCFYRVFTINKGICLFSNPTSVGVTKSRPVLMDVLESVKKDNPFRILYIFYSSFTDSFW